MTLSTKLLTLDLPDQLEGLGQKLIVELKNTWLLKLLVTLITGFQLICGP